MLEQAVKVAGLLAVLLPLVGAGIRAIAFGLGTVDDPLQMASRDSVAGLATTALSSLLLVATLTTASLLLYGIQLATLHRYLSWRGRPRWWHVDLPLGLYLLVISIFAFGFASWPGGAVIVIGTVGAGLGLYRFMVQGEITVYRTAAIALFVAVVRAIGAGLDGSGVGSEINNYAFTNAAGLPDGNYQVLGQSDGVVYLDSCENGNQYGVSEAQILDFTPALHVTIVNSSLFELLRGSGRSLLGFRWQCFPIAVQQ